MPDHDPGQLTARQLDLYAGQLARCLKTLGTDAPIRADVQRELATVRAEQESRASNAAVSAANRSTQGCAGSGRTPWGAYRSSRR
jgi:hypothetical protein